MLKTDEQISLSQRDRESSSKFWISKKVGALAGLHLFLFSSCALFVTRPVQEMSNTAAAIQAAKEVSADTLAPEYFRQAREWFFRARREYRFKNFKEAQDFAKRARIYAERAEFEALRNGADRNAAPPDPFDNSVQPPPPPPPDSTSFNQYETDSPREEDPNFEPKDNSMYYERAVEEYNRRQQPPPTGSGAGGTDNGGGI